MKFNIPYSKPCYSKYDKKKILNYVSDLDENWFGEFRETRKLEENLSKVSGANYVHAVNSGTSALICAFLSLGLKKNDEVLMTGYTHIATPNTAKLLGLNIRVVDIEKENSFADFDLIKKNLNKKIKCLVLSAINGRVSDSIFKICKLAKLKKIPIVIDGASALGSYKNNKKILSLGDITTTSFSTSKLISSGQGGAIFTNSKSIYDKIKPLKNFGRLKSTDERFSIYGLNFKMSDALSVLANSQLEQLETIAEKKMKVFKRYIKNLGKENFFNTDFSEMKNTYVDLIGCKNFASRNKLIEELKKNKIESRLMFPSLRSQPILKYIKGKTPVADEITKKGLLLPSAVDITISQIDRISKICEKYI
tara:strand:+ start:62 stop:1156 length:1095 start_codon:yes stop_codon:yes gene_type:complete